MVDPIFFAEKRGESFFLPEDELHHLSVYRIKTPSKILFTTGDGILYSGMVDKYGKIYEYIKLDHSTENEFVNLYFGLCDKSRMKFIFEKCTELGVKSFNPVITQKSERYPLKKDRVFSILKSAVKQSRRFKIPVYNEPIELFEIDFDRSVDSFFGSLDKKIEKTIEFKSESVNIFIGPPSGFTKEEEEFLIKNGVKPFFFDVAVLRTETFAVAFLSIIHYLKGASNG
ncbi:MAG: RsmE family RNA methyltransferase [candidate division WOR-3 bacterium]